MSKNIPLPLPPVSAWKSLVLRLTAFPSKPFQIPEPSWWLKLLGELPEDRVSKPRETGLLEVGPFHCGRLHLNVLPVKIDWLYTAADDQLITEKEGIPSIGPFLDSLEHFRPLMLRWLDEMCPPIQRLAFGAILTQPVEGHREGYSQLSAYIPSVKLETEGSSDFLYQINRPRNTQTGISGLEINRLCKWSVMKVQALFTTLPPSKVAIEGLNLFGCRLEMDINTAQDYSSDLPPKQLPQIFQELTDFGKEIAANGDIP